MAAPKRSSRKRAKKAASSTHASAPSAKAVPETSMANESFPVVGIGASAGGLEALEAFFANVSSDAGIAFIIVSHIDPHAVSFLPELLSRHTALTVCEAVDGRRLSPNEAVVTPPGKTLTVNQGVVSLQDIVLPHGIPLPIDILFRSLAEDQHERAIGIVLSGTGTDGTLGLQAIKSVSGMVMAQAPSSAKFPGMPQSAIDTGVVDFILPPDQMPEALLNYTQGPYLLPAEQAVPAPIISPEVLQDVLSLVHARTGHSFAAYKVSTIRRRLERRLNLHQIDSPEHYVRFLREHPDELEYLFHDMLIGVTSFFRDPEAYDALSQALRRLLESKRHGEPVRVWVPGCSTGEEAYSLAILLRELLEDMQKPCPVQVFATDLDDRSIEIARFGRYPEGIAIDVNAGRLQRFFTHENGVYQIVNDIREMVVFATHDLLVDPPFSHLDVLSCRNLLIYLESQAQNQLISLFHYALRPGGLLFLGSSETIGHLADLFSTEDRQWKLFVCNPNTESAYPLPEFVTGSYYLGTSHRSPLEEISRSTTPSSRAESYLAHRYAPPSVLITVRGDIMHFHGRTGTYLEPPRGSPNLNLYNMAREGLDRALSPAIRAALVHDGPVVRHGINVVTNGSTTTIDLVVERVTDAPPLQGLLLVSFRPTAEISLASLDPSTPGESRRRRRRMSDVERELEETRKSLQRTIEELEATNEELTSANEELQSTNEETQSANEELKTSKEEMQSLNEELQTVNAELRSKIDELSHTNDDMTNLLNSTEVATIFLGQQLQIKRYTPPATRVMALIPSDIGRPISDLTSHLDYPALVADAAEVLRTLVVQTKEVRTQSGVWYLVRIIPYRTSENLIDGVVLTFVDIDQVKQAEDAQEHMMAQLRAETEERQRVEGRLRHLSKVFQDATVPIILENANGIITDLNTEAEQVYGWRREELIGQPVKMLVPAEAHDEIDELLDRCRRGEDLRNIETRRQTQAGEMIRVRLTVSPLTNERGDLVGMATIAKHLDSV